MVQAFGEQYKDVGRNLLKNGVKVVFAFDYVGIFADAERTSDLPLINRPKSMLRIQTDSPRTPISLII